MQEFLFLGDSITDCAHSFDPENLGNGYVRMISRYFSQTSEDVKVHNMGVDGFTVSAVKRTWNLFCKDMKPDVITILVGINDIAVMRNTGLSLESGLVSFQETYESLIQEIRKTNDCPIILMEPFIFPWPVEFSLWEPDVRSFSQTINQIALEHTLQFLPLCSDLMSVAQTSGYDAVTLDGVHLTTKGHQTIAEKWLNLTCQNSHL